LKFDLCPRVEINLEARRRGRFDEAAIRPFGADGRKRARGDLHLGLEEPPTVLAKVNRTDEWLVCLGQREQVRPVRASIMRGFRAYVSLIVSSRGHVTGHRAALARHRG